MLQLDGVVMMVMKVLVTMATISPSRKEFP
jgi:hypothetical protein